MAFAALFAFVLLLGLTGRKPTRGSYVAIGLAAVAVSIWEFVS